MKEYINKGNKASKTGFGEGVLAAAQKDKRVVGLGADITASVGMNLFKEAFPERFSPWESLSRMPSLWLRAWR